MGGRGMIVHPGFIVVLVLLVAFIATFVGPPSNWRRYAMIIYAYFFTLVALFGALWPFFLEYKIDSDSRWRPAAIIVGCAEERGWSLPREVICAPAGQASDKAKFNALWLINLGGSMRVSEGAAEEPAFVIVSGGLVVPLYAVVLALIGSAVSMTRRVPEYQGKFVPHTVSSEQDTERMPKGKRLTSEEFAKLREHLVFQVMQVVSAPMIAVVAYYTLTPGTRTATVLIAFMSGFASASILMMLTAALVGLRERLVPGLAQSTDTPKRDSKPAEELQERSNQSEH